MGTRAEKVFPPLRGEAGPEEQIRRRKTGVGADSIRPQAFPWGKVAFAKQMTDEGGLRVWFTSRFLVFLLR